MGEVALKHGVETNQKQYLMDKLRKLIHDKPLVYYKLKKLLLNKQV